jgi:voltage-gated potassium channel
MVAGTAGYHYIEGWSWFDGFYMVVTTLTTIGYQEVHPLSQAGRIFNVFVLSGDIVFHSSIRFFLNFGAGGNRGPLAAIGLVTVRSRLDHTSGA